MKRIITCTDGTWNRPGATDRGRLVQTNVEKMYNAVSPIAPDGTIQLKAYDEGVGTGYSLRDKILGGITGLGLDRHIKNMYFFLCLRYEPGDHLYLFGFSRGAYTARSLGGFIRNCGILKPENIHLLDKAFELYRDRNNYTTPDSDLMKAFRQQYAHEDVTPIKFIGVWDTVGSLGIPLPFYRMHNAARYRFHDCKLSSTVENAYHALAIDDRRRLFTPTLWEQSDKVKNDPASRQKMEQCWFAGSHSNVGGGYADSGLSDIALQWLMDKAAATGLAFEAQAHENIKPDPLAELRRSYDLKYYFWRKIWRKIDTRSIHSNQVVDQSVKKRYSAHKTYRPRNIEGLIDHD